MYLEHFQIKEFPFILTPNVDYFCDLPTYQAALNVLIFSLKSGEGFVKIIGEVGSGKTLLCRKLLNELPDDFVTAYLPNPILSPNELRKALTEELQIDCAQIHDDQNELIHLLMKKLIDLRTQNKRAVFIIDEAQALSDENLEMIRLLTNLETSSEKLLQIVLFAQPELDERLKEKSLRQLNQRITFSYYLESLNYEDLLIYLNHRLATAGFTKGNFFNKSALRLLFQASGGIPRIVNILCHKAMLTAYGKGEKKIDRHSMLQAIKDSEIITRGIFRLSNRWTIFFIILIILLTAGLVYGLPPGYTNYNLSGFL